MTNPDHFILATHNTFFGRSIRSPDGLSFYHDTDILLLQEVYTPAADNLEARLGKAGFTLVGAGGHFGLVIALNNKSIMKLKEKTPRKATLQNVSRFSAVMTRKYSGLELELQDNGVLAAKFITQSGSEFTVATTHLPVVTAPRKRAHFLEGATSELQDPYYKGTLIFAGDMNHYPGPRRIDRDFRRKSDLAAVDLNGALTWPSKDAGFLESKIGRFYGGQLDDVLYRGELKPIQTEVIDARSDHKAIKVTFKLQ